LLLLLFIPLAFYLFKKTFDNEDHSSPAIIEKKPIVAKPESQPISPTGQSLKPVIVSQPAPLANTTGSDTLQSAMAQAADSVMVDSLSNIIAQEDVITDTIKSEEQTDTVQTIRKTEMPQYEITNWNPERVTTSHTPKWSLELAYSGQFDKWNSYNQPYTYEPKSLPGQSDPGTSPTIPSSIDNWSDYAVYLANNPNAASEQTRSIIMRIALSNANRPGEDKILRTSHHQMPVTWSLALKYKLNHRWGLETGLNYSKLISEFEMGEDGNKIEQRQTIHYLGIPVKGLFNIYGGKAWGLYGSAGLVTEIPVHAPLYSNYYVHGQYEASDKTTIRAPWQFSTTFGLGMQYHLTPHIGIFTEPSLQYFIPTHTDIETYRTEHPFTFSLPLGIRFTW
jgi:RNA polymerase sigma-70 factor (ECF subfamily)